MDIIGNNATVVSLQEKKTLTTQHTLYIGFLLSQIHKQNVESEASRHGQNLNGCFSQEEIATLTIKVTALIDGHK